MHCKHQTWVRCLGLVRTAGSGIWPGAQVLNHLLFADKTNCHCNTCSLEGVVLVMSRSEKSVLTSEGYMKFPQIKNNSVCKIGILVSLQYCSVVKSVFPDSMCSSEFIIKIFWSSSSSGLPAVTGSCVLFANWQRFRGWDENWQCWRKKTWQMPLF